MATLILLIVLCNNDLDTHEVTKHVDLIELNHFYHDTGQYGGTQIIFYKWKETCISAKLADPEVSLTEFIRERGYGYEVVGYYLIPFHQHEMFTVEERDAFVKEWKRKYPLWTKEFPDASIPSDIQRIKDPMLIPRKTANGDYTVNFKPWASTVSCRVYAPRFIRSVTTYDVEVYHRTLVPQDKREKSILAK